MLSALKLQLSAKRKKLMSKNNTRHTIRGANTNLEDCHNPKLIVLRRESRRRGAEHPPRRQGRSDWVAEYPYKSYNATGKTQAEALGNLLLQMAGYLDIEIRG